VLLSSKWATEAELEAIDAAVKKEVEEAVKFAEDSPMATAEELYSDVYFERDYPFEKD
jgi:pyruvate dehydrogenase E1 component alpha subunit